MRFTTEKSEIVQTLQMSAAIAERRQTIPILSNLRIVAKDEILEITATDLEIQIITKLKIKSVFEPGETTVSARKMAELCRSLPDNKSLDFSLINGKLSVTSNNFHADFSTIAASDFPELQKSEITNSFEIKNLIFKQLLEKTFFCMASQDVRYYLNGLLLEFKDLVLNSVATDGHRLALASKKVDHKIDDLIRVILPRKAVLELSKILDSMDENIEINFGTSSFSAKDKNLLFSCKLIEDKFPDYNKVFPTGNSSNLYVSKESLQSALFRSSVLSNEKYRGVKFSLNKNSLKLTANNPEQESAEEILDVDYSGSEMEIGFNIGYLLDVLHSLDTDDVEMCFYGEESSCLIKERGNNSEAYVIMPMRL